MTSAEHKPISIAEFSLSDSKFAYRDGCGWYADRLVKMAKDLEVFELPLMHIDIGVMPFQIGDIREFAGHFKRVQNTNLDYPVIMDSNGYIIDGWHRVAKAIVEGIPTVKAVRFKKMPPYDFTKIRGGYEEER